MKAIFYATGVNMTAEERMDYEKRIIDENNTTGAIQLKGFIEPEPVETPLKIITVSICVENICRIEHV